MLPAEAIKPAVAAYGYAFPQSVIIKHDPPHDLECQLYTFANTNSVRYQVSYSWYSSLDHLFPFGTSRVKTTKRSQACRSVTIKRCLK